MTDDEIRAALNDYDPDERVFAEIVRMGDVEPTGDAVADVRALADAYEIDAESVLYGLFSEESQLYKGEMT